MLTTFAGEEIRLAIDLREYDRLNEFENAVLNQLSYLGDSSTFGCELQFVHKDTRKVLADPIWDTLCDNHCFNVIARQCFVDAEHKGHLKGGAKAIRVPSSATDRILPQAFSFHAEVRHLRPEAGIRVVGEAAWRSCQRLQVVHLPTTVVCLSVSPMLPTQRSIGPGLQAIRNQGLRGMLLLNANWGNSSHNLPVSPASTTSASSLREVYSFAPPQPGTNGV